MISESEAGIEDRFLELIGNGAKAHWRNGSMA